MKNEGKIFVLMSPSSIFLKHISHSYQQPPPYFYAGMPGMHGKPGLPGAPGRDGRDGREGVKGDRGSPGKTGSQGPPGLKGTPGVKGEPGVQGPPGQKGQRGESGINGIPGTPGVMSFKNWKECAWNNLNEGKDHGLIKVNSYGIETKNSLTYICCSINFSF